MIHHALPNQRHPSPSIFEFRISNFRGNRRAGSIILKALIILILAGAVFGGGAYFAYTLFIQPDQNLKQETAFGTPTPPPDMTIPEYQRCLQLKNDHQYGPTWQQTWRKVTPPP